MLIKTLAIASVFMLASCATIVKGTKQMVSINSNVNGATVYLDDIEIGKTPFVGEIPKGKKVMRVQKDGYEDYTIPLSTSLEGMFWGNILTGGTVGSITDFASGAAYQYAPASYQIDLKANGVSQPDFKADAELRKYSMTHLSVISSDIGLADGAYTNGLLDLLRQQGVQLSREELKSLIQQSQGDEVEFGNRIVALAD